MSPSDKSLSDVTPSPSWLLSSPLSSSSSTPPSTTATASSPSCSSRSPSIFLFLFLRFAKILSRASSRSCVSLACSLFRTTSRYSSCDFARPSPVAGVLSGPASTCFALGSPSSSNTVREPVPAPCSRIFFVSLTAAGSGRIGGAGSGDSPVGRRRTRRPSSSSLRAVASSSATPPASIRLCSRSARICSLSLFSFRLAFFFCRKSSRASFPAPRCRNLTEGAAGRPREAAYSSSGSLCTSNVSRSGISSTDRR
mmetsp:Transcript_5311/g.10844  ORF Transcript_5311/g.10844 Transcript_5311/m.10844 type:complete len:254 (-) Transcript_5311:984-1745(-)